MIELPEGIAVAKQIDEVLVGKTVIDLIVNSSPHKFAWYYGEPAEYRALFSGRTLEGAYSYGGKLHIRFNGDRGFMFCDGVNIRYYTRQDRLPKKHQLYIEFDDSTYLICSVQMYGGIYGYTGLLDNGYDAVARSRPMPLSDAFNLSYFTDLLSSAKKGRLSAKAFLATEQRIPGLGNGVVQDILFNAGISPKRDMATLSSLEFEQLFRSTKETLLEMTQKNGRDVETDLFGNSGRYRTLMSKNTLTSPCPRCGGEIRKESYLGGSVYYCPDCQR